MITKDYYKSDILYRCETCGEIFSEHDKIEWEQEEYRGECWGQGSWETMTYQACPCCQSDEFDRYYPDEEDDEETDSE